MRVGVYSGSFDPVHYGHLSFAEDAIGKMSLEKVVFLPEREPRGKPRVTAYSHRLKMLDIALEDYNNLEVVDINDSQFTVQSTWPKLRRLFPDDEIVLLFGSDVLNNILSWDGLGDLLANVKICVSVRGGDSRKWRSVVDELRKFTELEMLFSRMGDVSATNVRAGDESGVVPKVLEYINEEKIYERV